MKREKENVVLIGMPGAGKSTLGVLLAKELGYVFCDADLLIQQSQGALLREIIASEGMERFLDIEEKTALSMTLSHVVVATGGSAVYRRQAMEHYGSMAVVVYLHLPCERLRERLGSMKRRGVVLKEGQTLEELYEERRVLYEKYADLTVEVGTDTVEESLDRLVEALRSAGIAPPGEGKE